MYPGIATTKKIQPQKMDILHFKEAEDKRRNPLQSGMAPAVNITETVSEYRIQIAAPGLQQEEFSIEIEDCLISISAKKEVKKRPGIRNHFEYGYCYWTRAFSLPDDADPLLAHAKYKNGELLIRIPHGNTKDNKTKATVYVY